MCLIAEWANKLNLNLWLWIFGLQRREISTGCIFFRCVVRIGQIFRDNLMWCLDLSKKASLRFLSAGKAFSWARADFQPFWTLLDQTTKILTEIGSQGPKVNCYAWVILSRYRCELLANNRFNSRSLMWEHFRYTADDRSKKKPIKVMM